MKVSLFWKTCPKDEAWMSYSVRSVDRFARGFHSAVIVTDGEHLPHVPTSLPVHVHNISVPALDPKYGFGNQKTLEYFYASAIKASWMEYTDADAVVWIDSDLMFVREVTPAFWFAGDRPLWYRVPWSESPDGCKAWKRGVDHLFGVDSRWEYMCVCSGMATRRATDGLHAYIRGKFNQSVREYFLDPSHGKLGEYPMIGGYLDLVDPQDYIIRQQQDIREPWPVAQFWSWDPNGPPREKMERILEG